MLVARRAHVLTAYIFMANLVMDVEPLQRAAMLVEPRRHRLELGDRRRI